MFVCSYIYDRDVAEDIVSESLIKLWTELRKKDVCTYNIKSFLFTILRNASLDYLRHQTMRYRVEKDITSIHERNLEIRLMSLQNSVYDEVLIKEIQEIVDKTISTMKPRTQEIFKLSRFDLLTNKEIAAQLDITEKGVEYHMSIALKKMKISLKDYTYLIGLINLFL